MLVTVDYNNRDCGVVNRYSWLWEFAKYYTVLSPIFLLHLDIKEIKSNDFIALSEYL